MAGATSRQEVNDQSCLLDCCIEVNEYHVSVAVSFCFSPMKLKVLPYETKHLSLQKMTPLDSTNLTRSDQ